MLLNATRTVMGSRRLKEWLLHPLRAVEAINARLDVVELLLRHPDCLSELHARLESVSGDATRELSRLARLYSNCVAPEPTERVCLCVQCIILSGFFTVSTLWKHWVSRCITGPHMKQALEFAVGCLCFLPRAVNCVQWCW